jgi:hypothetical protein
VQLIVEERRWIEENHKHYRISTNIYENGEGYFIRYEKTSQTLISTWIINGEDALQTVNCQNESSQEVLDADEDNVEVGKKVNRGVIHMIDDSVIVRANHIKRGGMRISNGFAVSRLNLFRCPFEKVVSEKRGERCGDCSLIRPGVNQAIGRDSESCMRIDYANGKIRATYPAPVRAKGKTINGHAGSVYVNHAAFRHVEKHWVINTSVLGISVYLGRIVSGADDVFFRKRTESNKHPSVSLPVVKQGIYFHNRPPCLAGFIGCPMRQLFECEDPRIFVCKSSKK